MPIGWHPVAPSAQLGWHEVFDQCRHVPDRVATSTSCEATRPGLTPGTSIAPLSGVRRGEPQMPTATEVVARKEGTISGDEMKGELDGANPANVILRRQR